MGGSGLFAAKPDAAGEQGHAGSFDPQFNDTIRTIEVEAVTLDSYFVEGSRIDFIKIDAEGGEPHILAGAARLLSENGDLQIMLEFAPGSLQRGGSSAEAFYASVRDLGFRVFRIEHDSSLVESKLSDLVGGPAHYDVLLRR
jgi:hypothetical protein